MYGMWFYQGHKHNIDLRWADPEEFTSNLTKVVRWSLITKQ